MYKEIEKDERGVAHLLYIALIVIVIAAVGVVGWKVAKDRKTTPSSTSSSSTSSSKAATSATDSSCLAAYHDSILCKFASNSNTFDKTAYTATLSVTQNGTSSTMTLANDGKGNTKLTESGASGSINAITLNGNSYIQDNSSGPWIEYPSGSSTPTSNPTNSMDIGVGSAGITYKALGTTSCGSLTCYKYQVIDSTTPTATQYAYFDNSSYKLREWQYTDGSGNTTTMNVSYGAVDITTPSPVETLSQAE